MSGVRDNAAGAILHIPQEALDKIKEAEKAIKQLQATSETAARKIKGHFDNTAISGLNAFIKKIQEARTTLEDVGKATVTLNTQQAMQAGEALSSQMLKTSNDVSHAIQSIASLPIDISSISALTQSAEQAGVTFQQLEQLIKNYERGRAQTAVESPEAMAMNNAIEKLKEYIALKKKSDEQLARVKTDPEKDYLAEQKRLMTDLLNIRKQINAQSTKVQTGRITGNENLKEEEADLRRLFARYQESYRALQTLNSEKGKDLGAAARTEAEVNAEKYKTEVLKQQITYRQKLSAEITRANELTAQGQQGKTRLGSGEEAAIQRQLNSDYKGMLKIIKEQGEIKAKVAAEGRRMTQEEIKLIAALGQRYKIYYDDVNRISGAYKNMAEAAQKAFISDKSEQMARNAILLADAKRKAAESTQKQEEAERKAAEAAQQKALAEKLSAAKLAGQQYAQSYEGAIKQFENMMSGKASGKLTINLENVKRVLNDLQTAAGKLNLLDSSDAAKAEKLKKAIQELNRIVQQYKKVTNATPEKPIISPTDAINAAKNAKTLKELQDAYKNLKTVMATVDPKSAQWQQMNQAYGETKKRIDAIRASMGEFQNQTRRTAGAAAQLRNQLAMVFSASAIYGYIKKMVEVRAQFELQNVALRAILQNKDEADRIFAQVQQMAMQSPFTIMQLTTYSKQLAAYRIESEKLLGTTKMLADVSAGLGVDMQRLILAYGQVKSANYLRACLGVGTPVMLYDGTFKNVEDIAVGDMLMGDDEKPRNVSKLYHGVQMMYRVSYEGGEFRCNEHHILTVYDTSKERIADVFVLDYLKEPHLYQGVRRIDGRYEIFPMRVEADKTDDYYGFSIDGNHRFIIQDNIVTHNTEVRQFTEAGLNIAGELAQYFSELQGSMVSVGDVMGMITKRMVRFEDVEEVFKRVTSAGGLFYDMQKKQSDSLMGQLQRIQDAYSIMFNEIGQSNQETISGALTLIRELIQNWRELLPLLGAFSAFFASKAIIATLAPIVKSFATIGVLLKDIIKKQVKWNALASKNVWGAVLSVIMSIVAYIALANNEASKLAEELGRIRREASSDLKESIADFHQLAKTATDATKSYTERKEALEALNRAYKDIVPSYMLEAEWLEKQVGNYDAVIAKIQEYFRAKEMQKQIDTILNSEYYTEAIKEMKEMGEEMLNQGIFDVTVTKKYTDAWMEQIASEIASGKLENSAEAVSGRLSEIFGKKITIPENQWEDVSENFKKIDDEINHITLGTIAAKNQAQLFGEELGRLSVGQIQKRITDAQEQMKKLNWEIASEQRNNRAFRMLNGEDSQRAIRRINELMEQYDILTANIAKYEQAMSTAWGRETTEKIKETTAELQEEIKAVSKLTRQRNELAHTNTGTEEENNRLKELNDELEIAKTRTKKLADGMGVELTDAELENIDNLFELDRLLNTVAEEAFPFLAEKAVESATQGETAIKSLVDKVDWLKRAINTFATGLGFDPVFKGVLTETQTKTEEEAAEVERLRQVEKDRNEEYIKGAAERAKIDAKSVLSMTEFKKTQEQSDSDYAKGLRNIAKAWRDQKAGVDDMSETQRNFYFESNHLTQARIDELNTMADVAEDVANAYDPEAKKETGEPGGSGTDPWIEIFRERTKAIQDFYKQYETISEKFSESESQRRTISSFESYFETAGLNMADVISRGWNTQGLIANIEQLQKDLKKHFGAIYDEAEDIMRKGITLDVVENPTAKQKLTHALAKLIHDLEKQEADNKIKIDFEIQEQRLEKLKKDFDNIFADYNLTKELSDLGLDIDLTYLVGGKPMTLEQARKSLQDTYNKAIEDGKLGKDAEKEYKDAIKKLDDIEHKAQIARLKNYNRYLIESIGERAQIEVNAMQEINKIRQSEELDNFSKEQAIMQRRKKMHEDLAKFDFDQFKGSDVYLTVFKDLENASKEQLQYVIDKLKEMQTTFKDLSPLQVKSLANEIKKMEDALADKDAVKNLFANLKESISYIRQRNTLLEEQTNTQKAINSNQSQLTVAEKRLVALTQQRDAIQDKNSDEWEEANSKVAEQQFLVQILQENVADLEKRLKKVTGQIEKGVAAWLSFKKELEEVQDKVSAVKTSLDTVFSGLDSMGLVSDEFRDVYESLSEVMGGIDTMMSGLSEIDIARPFSIITGGIKAIGGVFQTIGGFFGIGDKKKERQIGRLQEKVEDLKKTYEDLHDAMEEAYQFDDYNVGYEASMKNLDAQAKALDEMIRLEEDKKKTDEDKIKELKEAREEINKARKELREERYEEYGSITKKEYRNESEAFASAWLDAFKETGDGLDALTEHWNDFFENLVIKQAASAVVSKKMGKYIDEINAAIESGDTGLGLSQAFKDIGERLKEELPEWSSELEAFFEALGYKGGSGNLVLSDLQKGIQNITEPQAAAIEAYMNSIRFAVFRHTEQLDTLITTIQAQYGSGADNPIVTELKGIKSVLDSIDNRLGSVISTRVGQTGIMIVG